MCYKSSNSQVGFKFLFLKVVNQTFCAKSFAKIKTVEVTDSKICAFDPTGTKDACQGIRS